MPSFGRTTSYIDDEEDTPDYESYTGYTDEPADAGGSSANPMGGSRVKSPAQSAREEAATHANERPERPKVGLLRNLAAIGLGFGGAYANATGKGLPQVNVGDTIEGVRYGGYNRKVQDWGNKQGDLETRAKDLTQSEQLEASNARGTAQTNEANARTRLYGAQADQYEAGNKNRSPYRNVPKEGSIFNEKTGTYIPNPDAPPPPSARTFKAAAIQAFQAANGRPPTIEEAADMEQKFSKVPPDKLDRTTVALIASGWDPHGGVPPTPEQSQKALKLSQTDDPLRGFLAQMTQDRSDRDKSGQIEKNKQDALARAEAKFTEMRAKLVNDPAEADAWLANEKNRIQQAYLQEIEAAKMPTHGVQPMGIPPPPPPSSGAPRQGGSPTAPPAAGVAPIRPGMPPPVTPGNVPAPPPVTATDPKVIDYANKFFGGDVQAAMAAIQQQRGAR